MRRLLFNYDVINIVQSTKINCYHLKTYHKFPRFHQIKGLGESDGNDDMTSWVANMRRKEEERKRREEFERAQEEFGLTNEKKEDLKSRDQVYTNMNLQVCQFQFVNF